MSLPNAFSGPVTDADEADARISAWAKGFADKAARYREVGERTESLRLTASSPNGAVEVTVRADGSLIDLRFGDRARTVPIEHLSTLVMDTLRQAQSGIADRVAEVMVEGLGDEDLQTRSVVLDNLRSRFPAPDAEAEPEAEEPSATAASDDEENEPW